MRSGGLVGARRSGAPRSQTILLDARGARARSGARRPTMPATAMRPDRPCLPGRAPSISAVLPAYNEEAIIEQTVLDLANVLDELVDDYEIIVVDDGSRDDTFQRLMALAERNPEMPLRVVVHKQNRGYGAALASGFDT